MIILRKISAEDNRYSSYKKDYVIKSLAGLVKFEINGRTYRVGDDIEEEELESVYRPSHGSGSLQIGEHCYTFQIVES